MKRFLKSLLQLLPIVALLLPPVATAAADAPAGKLVFQQASGGPIYTVNLDGTDLRQVGAGIDPSWSPDGEQITYADWNEPRGIYVMNADGSNVTRLYDASETRSPKVEPRRGNDCVREPPVVVRRARKVRHPLRQKVLFHSAAR
ncbi:MAG: hypothetical protein M5U01_22260 [Ardenticatenaceae bacterium]|nr:hypothetical protein [Ardenticatenaceae bacterium]